jgi:glycosyltransferase involved in cell wall biosynthesis
MREGFGIAFIEANACGLPVVTIKHPQNAAGDLIVNGENGYTCDPTEEDLASKIILAIEKSSDMKPKCMAYAQKYDWDKIVDRVEAVYESICSGRKPES